MKDPSDRLIAAWLALLLLGIYLLSFSGLLYSQDSMSMFSVTESFVKRGEFNTDQLWTLFKARDEIAPDGESYAKYGYGASLFAVPLYALAYYLPFDLRLTQTTLLTSSMAIAVAGALVFLSARRLQFSRNASVVAALLFGLATPAWVYAKQFWSEPYSLLTLFAAFYFLQRFRAESRARNAVIAGIALGLAVATRVTNAALIPVFAWYGFDRLSDARVRRGLVGFAGALGVIALSIAGYDWVRYGNPLATGYRADETFNTPILLGMYGLLFSPGKGLFVYVPFLVALPFAATRFFQRVKSEALLMGAITAFYVLLFSTWYYWWGGTNWGPRFLLPTIPFLVLMTCPLIELALARTKKWFTALFAGLALLSVAIQLLGVIVPALAYRARMLKLSANPDMDAIFVPQFSPIIGSLNLLRPSVFDFAWWRVIDGEVQIDWLVIALTIAFIGFCAFALNAGVGRRRFVVLGAIVFVLVLALFSMSRYRDDPRFSGSEYRALLGVVAREEHPGDVLILDDDARAPFLLNANRARLRWYGLSRDPKQFDAATMALLTRLAQRSARVWFAYDDATGNSPDPTRDWLDRSLQLVAQHDFDDGVHLVLYAPSAIP